MTNNSNCAKISFVQEQAQLIRAFCRNMLQTVTSISGGGSQVTWATVQTSGKAPVSKQRIDESNSAHHLNSFEQYPCSHALISFAPEDIEDEAPEQITNEILTRLDKSTLEKIATYSSTPHSVLEILSKHDHADVRGAVSENVNASELLIWSLAKDNDPTVRYQLAENPHLPFAVLQSLTNDDNSYVACRAQTTIARISG